MGGGVVNPSLDYDSFLKSKVTLAQKTGIDVGAGDVNPALKPHQAAIAHWMVTGGRRACFASFGLGKTVIQLEVIRMIVEQVGGRGLIITPLGVRQEFIHDALEILKWETAPKFIRHIDEAGAAGIYLTNYETVRDGKLDPCEFAAVSLDEAAVLRGFGGSKTFREFMLLFTGDGGPSGRSRDKVVPYRFVATATPSPNEYIELLAYADFLGVMDVSQAKTRFFKRDSTKADKLTLHAHKAQEFWLWVSSWAMFVQKPSDLGFPDEGYDLPEMQVHWHEVATNHKNAGYDKSGQGKLIRDAAIGVQDASSEKRSSMGTRINKLREIVQDNRALVPEASTGGFNDQMVIWCDLNDEQHAVESALKKDGVSFSSIYGSMKQEHKENLLIEWKDKKTVAFVSKAKMHGAGVNLQQCHTMIFAGIGFKFYELIQAIHRIFRFLQTHPCNIHIIHTEAEREVRKQLERKWQQHNTMVKQMSEIIQKYGLSHSAMAQALTRKMGTERVEISGENYTLVNNDSVIETAGMKENSVGLILTSIPFSSQYEYSPNYADFGHSENNDQFFKQMDFLTPNLLRVLQPGRIAAIHVKDRIIPGGMTGLGFQTVYPFHARAIDHYTRHGFAYMGMKTIVTDVVRENNQTYRLGWTEQCKDGTKMGVGMPEYLLIFRKPPTGTENSYADNPVTKKKSRYTRSRWQTDAHGFTRSSGDRLLTPDELLKLKHSDIFKIFRDYSLEDVYNFEHHVKIGETLDLKGKLPSDFMLLQPQSWHPDVWTDITRMLTLNGAQSSKGKEMHLCPMQFDLADRVIEQMSMEGETVLDPFGGLMTVPLRAIMQKRRGYGIELNPGYFLDGSVYCKAKEAEMSMPTLFDLVDSEEPIAEPVKVQKKLRAVAA